MACYQRQIDNIKYRELPNTDKTSYSYSMSLVLVNALVLVNPLVLVFINSLVFVSLLVLVKPLVLIFSNPLVLVNPVVLVLCMNSLSNTRVTVPAFRRLCWRTACW